MVFCTFVNAKLKQMKKIAVFPGSFDPFTIGHKYVLDLVLPLFDEIIVAIGVNSEKKTMFTEQERIEKIKNLYQNEPKISVESYSSLTVDFCKSHNAQYIVRGLRNTTDFEYEKSIAQMNKELAGIETLFLMTPPQYEHVSSSIVRELIKYGVDVSTYVP